MNELEEQVVAGLTKLIWREAQMIASCHESEGYDRDGIEAKQKTAIVRLEKLRSMRIFFEATMNEGVPS